MQNADWITLFRQMPADAHSTVMLILNNRMEVSIETVFRVEPSYILVRGRLSGTTDGGLPFMVPYDQMTAMYLYREIKETEVEKIFGPSRIAGALRSNQGTAPQPTEVVDVVPLPNEPALRPSNVPSPGVAMPAFGRPSEATAVARNNLLERLRAARQAAQPNGK